MAALAALLAIGACSQQQPTELRGLVDGGMMKQVANALNDGHRDFTVDSSNGGSVLAAEIIAVLIRERQGSLTVTGRCWSACALMLLGVQRNYAGADADVRIHGARSVATRSEDKPGDDKAADEKAADAAAAYMIKHGLSAEIARTRGTGTNLYRLTPVELAEAGVDRANP